jgi:hypothetical protein
LKKHEDLRACPRLIGLQKQRLSNDQHFRQTIDTTTARPQSLLFAEVILGPPGAAYP